MIHYLQNGRLNKPHIVIFHEGGNDVAPLLFPNYRADYSHFRSSQAGGARPFERRLLKNSYTLRVVYIAWLRSNAGVYSPQPYGFDKVPRDKAVQMVASNKSSAFESNLTTIVRESISNESKVFFSGFFAGQRRIYGKKSARS